MVAIEKKTTEKKKRVRGHCRFYPAYDEPKPKTRYFKPKTAKLRKSIQPGQVLIILAGRFRGKRVVFLKQLESGLLLVTGPYKLNGVPLRRVNQAYVLPTKTKVDLKEFTNKLDKFNDKYFVVPAKKAKKSYKQYHIQRPVPVKIAQERKEDQKVVDNELLKIIKKQELLKQYLSSLFTLTHRQYPHQLVF